MPGLEYIIQIAEGMRVEGEMMDCATRYRAACCAMELHGPKTYAMNSTASSGAILPPKRAAHQEKDAIFGARPKVAPMTVRGRLGAVWTGRAPGKYALDGETS